jgi:Holliday junction resolvase
MAMTPEGAVKKKVAALLKKYNAYYFFPAMGAFGRAGVPDIVGCYRGYFFAVECKAGAGKTTALQDAEIDKIRKVGGKAFVINEHNLDLLETYLKENCNGTT